MCKVKSPNSRRPKPSRALNVGKANQSYFTLQSGFMTTQFRDWVLHRCGQIIRAADRLFPSGVFVCAGPPRQAESGKQKCRMRLVPSIASSRCSLVAPEEPVQKGPSTQRLAKPHDARWLILGCLCRFWKSGFLGVSRCAARCRYLFSFRAFQDRESR